MHAWNPLVTLLITLCSIQREEEEDEKRLKHMVMVEGVCQRHYSQGLLLYNSLRS
jgi:hypothetical protein